MLQFLSLLLLQLLLLLLLKSEQVLQERVRASFSVPEKPAGMQRQQQLYLTHVPFYGLLIFNNLNIINAIIFKGGELQNDAWAL